MSIIYSNGFDIAAMIISIFCLMTYLMRKRIELPQHYLFIALQIVMILTCVTTILSAQARYDASVSGDVIRYAQLASIFDMLYFVVHMVMPPLLSFYILTMSGSLLRRLRRQYLILLVPCFITELLVLANPFLHMIFYTDAMGNYQRGPGMPFLYLVSLFYFVYGIASLVRTRNAISNHSYYSILALLIVILFGVATQLLLPHISFELFTESIAFLGLLVTVEARFELFDPLTGAYNANAFSDENTRLLRNQISYRVIRVQLLNIRLQSRLLDIQTLNGLLRDITAWLRGISQNAGIYHYSPGNFALLYTNTDDAEIQQKLVTIRRKFDHDWTYRQLELPIYAVLSVARVPEDFDSPETLNSMMEYESPNAPIGVSILSNENMQYIRRESDIEHAINEALEKRSFKILYQPIAEASSGRIIAAEALVRLENTEIGNIPSDEFIRIAEKNGMITEIGNYVFEEVCRFLSEVNIHMFGLEYVEVNLSLYQCLLPNLPRTFQNIMSKYHIPIDDINLEITETVASDESALMSETIMALSKSGFALSLDDFGTGFSNFAKLLEINFANIKIDKRFTVGLGVNDNAHRILRYMAETARHLGSRVILEGVESGDQLTFARNLGIDYVQGYYFSPPLERDDFISYLRGHNTEATRIAASLEHDKNA